MTISSENSPLLLSGALPPDPNQLFRLQRLCVRMFSELTKDLAEQTQEMAKAGGGSWRKHQSVLAGVLGQELPILILLRVLDGLERDKRLEQPGLLDLLRGLLLPLFSLCFQQQHEHPSAQFKRVLSRIDWYLDSGDDPVESFGAYCAAEAEASLKDKQAVLTILREKFMPEIDLRLNNTLRQEFL